MCQENWYKDGGVKLELKWGNDDTCMAVIMQKNRKQVESAWAHQRQIYEFWAFIIFMTILECPCF